MKIEWITVGATFDGGRPRRTRVRVDAMAYYMPEEHGTGSVIVFNGSLDISLTVIESTEEIAAQMDPAKRAELDRRQVLASAQRGAQFRNEREGNA